MYLVPDDLKGPFNRTIVELKQPYQDYAERGQPAFNRTIVELKLNGAERHSIAQESL